MEQTLSAIIYQQLQGKPLLPEEQAQLDAWLAAAAVNREIFQSLQSEQDFAAYLAIVTNQEIVNDAFAAFLARKRRIYALPRLAWAAAIALILAGAVLLFLLPHAPRPALRATILPGSGKAILTLANGVRIPLDNKGHRQISTGLQQQGGQLLYTGAGNASYNILSTPRGGQFMVQLPDGSKVWLNAASTLRYPSAFTGATRRVELTGEAYFEIAPGERQPFRVSSKGQEILVLGTRFNVNAYEDEPVVTTTLISGKVKVNAQELQPGEQLQLSPSGQWQVNSQSDKDAVLAWKNGFFSFNHTNLAGVLRQLARWYDVDISIETTNTTQAFVGEIPRNVSLQKALQILQFSDVHYIIQGRTIRIVD